MASITLVANPKRREGATLGTQRIGDQVMDWRIASLPCGPRGHVYCVARYNANGKHDGRAFTPDGLGFRTIVGTIASFQQHVAWLSRVSA
jgi:hypothetical protein